MEFNKRLLSRNRKKFDVLLISSDQDKASLNIRDSCLELYPFETSEMELQGNPVFVLDSQKFIGLVTVSEELVTLNAESLEVKFPASLYIFISCHRSEKEQPALLVHTPGNWSDNALGGRERILCISHALAVKTALKTLSEQKYRLNLDSFNCSIALSSF